MTHFIENHLFDWMTLVIIISSVCDEASSSQCFLISIESLKMIAVGNEGARSDLFEKKQMK